jgi:hypothetical protein
MFKRYWLFWGVTQCKLVVNVKAYETGYIIWTAAEALNLKVIFEFRKQQKMYRCICKIVALQSTKQNPCSIDCLEAWERQPPGPIRACPGANLSYLSAPCIRCYFVDLIFCRVQKMRLLFMEFSKTFSYFVLLFSSYSLRYLQSDKLNLCLSLIVWNTVSDIRITSSKYINLYRIGALYSSVKYRQATRCKVQGKSKLLLISTE